MLKSLLRVRFAELFRGGTRGRSGSTKKTGGAGKIVLFAILMLYVAASVFLMMFGTFFTMMPTLAAANAQWLVFAVAAIASCALSLLLDTPMAQAQLYEAHDNEMLLSLPIPPRTILFSRMLSMYLFSLIYAAMFYIPAFVVCALYMPVTVLRVVGFVLAMLFGQLVPLALSCLLGRFFAYLKRKFQKAQIITAVVLGLLMCVYFYFCGNLSNIMQTLTQNAAPIAASIRQNLPPFYFFGLASLGDPLALLGTLLVCSAVFAAVYAYLSRTFLRTAIPTGNRGKKQADRAEAPRPVMGALVLREARHFTSSSMVMMNAGLGLLMQLAAGVFLILRGKAFLAEFSEFVGGDMLCALGVVCLCLLCCTDVISGTSVSMERNNIWILQSLPVSASKVLFAKALSHFFICAPFAVVSSVLFAIALSANAVQTAFLIVLPLLMTAFCALFGVRMNLLFPRLDFVSDVAVVKRSGSVICTMLGTWALVGICVMAYLFFGARIVSVNAALCCFALVLIFGCAACAAYLNGRGAKKFSRLS